MKMIYIYNFFVLFTVDSTTLLISSPFSIYTLNTIDEKVPN